MRMQNLNVNHIISYFVSRLQVGLLRKLRFIKLIKTDIILRLLRLLYKHGVIRTYRIDDNYVCVYFKYINGQPIVKLSGVSRPGKRCYWSLGKLSQEISVNNFSGFYIISTPHGLVTSTYCLLTGRVSGEVLIKVEI